MDARSFAQIGAIVLLAAAITLTALAMQEVPQAASEPIAIKKRVRDIDPLRAELARCQSIGQAGATDLSCLHAWAENRRRFLSAGSGLQEHPTSRQSASVHSASYEQEAQ